MADSAYITDLCRITFDLNIKVIKSFCLGKKIDKKHRPILILFNNYEIEAKILLVFYFLPDEYI